MKRLVYLLVIVSAISYGQNPKIIAHRGYSHVAPENTLAAFQKAIDINADYFELDVQLSIDDSLIIMHDATVDRTTNGTGTVSSMTYQQLHALDAGSWFSTDYAWEGIPTLRESLILAKNSANNIGVIVEIKTSDSSVPKKIVELIQSLGMESRVIVSGFSLAQITLIKNEDQSIPVQLFATITTSYIDQVAAINGEWVGSGGNFTQEMIDYAHTKGIKYNAWTINSASQMIPLIDIGIDAITTDFPEVLMAALDDTEPSDVVLSSATAIETDVSLSWEPAEDLESGITGYDIFRDETPEPTSLLVSVGKLNEYIDKTYTESQQYYYRIKAKNSAGLSSINYSNEISVTTLADVVLPTIKYVTSKGDHSSVILEFSERVDKTTAEDILNYTLNNEATVLNAELALDLKSIILTTSTLSEQAYFLDIENIKDRANTPNTMESISLVFLHQGIPDSEVAYYKLDNISPDNSILDETKNLNHGLAQGGISQTAGVLGNALSFDGIDDCVQLYSSSSYNIDNNAVTVSLWTKLEYLPTELPDSYGPLFDSDGDQYVLYEDRGNSELRFKVATSNGAERPGISSDDLITGEWIHIAGVYNGSEAMIYLNGEKKDSHSLTGTVKPGQIASLGRNGSTYFEGSIDQVEVFNIALNDSEVVDLFENYRDVVFTCSEIDASVSQYNDILTSTTNGATYQWLDCDNEYNVISDETNQSFTPTVTGNYAVEISMNGCIDTSECVYVLISGLSVPETSTFTVFPNPNDGNFTIDLNTLYTQNAKIEIINSMGQIVLQKLIDKPVKQKIELLKSNPGIYTIRVYSDSRYYVNRIIIL